MCDVILERLKSLHPKIIDLALDRIRELLATLGHPERSLPPVVHVAGTNGKGSTVALLRAFIEAAGLTAHVYTSPHLVRFAERIRVAGQIIGEDELASLLGECEAKNAGRQITFFEITTAAAFLAFARRPADVCLLETGMGGQFDATNVIEHPAVTVLTPISFDHQGFLGETLTAIAGEKAGILKPGVPCVSARQQPEALAVIGARAASLDAPLFVGGRDWTVEKTAEGLRFSVGGSHLKLPAPALLGSHQIHNAGVAIAAARVLDGVLAGRPLTEAVLARGLAQVSWPARLQRLTRGPLAGLLPEGWQLWLDGGHNPSAGAALALFAEEHWGDRPFDLVVGMLNTKDVGGFLVPLARRARRLRAVGIPGEANALSAEQVATIATARGIASRTADSVAAAIADLAGGAGPARILICGSLYLAGVVLAENG
jgi:dihydrofolate synthase/folylpolyglutamate synthase